MNAVIISHLGKNITISYAEKPKSRETTISRNNPKSKLEFWASGSADDTVIAKALGSIVPLDYTVNGITRFLKSVKYNTSDAEPLNANWDIAAEYESTADQIDMSFDMSTGTTKMMQSRATINSYNCIQLASEATGVGADELYNAANLIDLTDVKAKQIILNEKIVEAIAAALVVGVDPDVLALIVPGFALDAADVVTTSRTVVGPALGTQVAGLACYDAAMLGDVAATQAKATETATAADVTAVKAATVSAAAVVAQDTNVLIQAAAAGGNAETLAAADACADVMVAALDLDVACAAVATAADDTKVLAAALAILVAADTGVGNNGVPNFGRAIGVHQDGTVDGVETEVPKTAFSINFKKKLSTLPSSYLQTLLDLQLHTNDAEYTINWKGQVMTFSPESLKFVGAPFKQNGEDDLDLTFKFEASRSITTADNQTIGNSAPLTKKGWHYLWVYYTKQLDSATGRMVMKPAYALVERIYLTGNFALFGLS